VSAVAGLGALLLMAVAGRWLPPRRARASRGGAASAARGPAVPGTREVPVIAVGQVVRAAPWQIVLFSLGMYLVVYGLRNAGLTDLVSRALEGLASEGMTAAAVGTGLLTASLSAVMNNLPSVLVGALAIDGAQALDPAIREAMIYANVIGCDLGPKMSPIGSLATLLWLHVLARKGMRVGW